MSNWSIVVKKTGRTFGVFGRVPGKPDDLIEGGFFHRGAAELARNTWERECQKSEFEDADRRIYGGR